MTKIMVYIKLRPGFKLYGELDVDRNTVTFTNGKACRVDKDGMVNLDGTRYTVYVVKL